jgi:CRP-like cAMP-binding protein
MSGKANQEMYARIAEHPFMAGLDREFLELIARKTTERTYERGDVLFREEETAKEFFLIVHGKIALEVAPPEKNHLTIQTVQTGEVVGWSWLIPPYKWAFDARVLKTTKVLAVDAAALREILETHCKDAYQFLIRLLPVIGTRLENTRLQLMDIYGV